jgi:integrase
MIITALDTGIRLGEMLALRFGCIDFTRGLITLPGETTKSRRTRFVPIATARLRAVPRVVRWREVHVKAWAFGEPVPDQRRLWVL